jgi:hypothetical protein
MKTIDFKRVKRWGSGHHNPHKNIVVLFDRGLWELESGHGSGDDIHVFKEDGRILVLTINHGLGYVGLSEYNLGDKPSPKFNRSGDDDPYYSIEEDGNVFLDKDYEIEETLGPKGLDLAPMTIAKRLIEYLPY